MAQRRRAMLLFSVESYCVHAKATAHAWRLHFELCAYVTAVKHVKRVSRPQWQSNQMVQLSEGWRRTILIVVREVYLVTEEDHPLAQLDWCHDHSVGRPPILTVVVKRLQQQFWSRGTGEIEANHLYRRNTSIFSEQ